MPGVTVDGVSKHFGAVRAVDGVSLTVADGQLLTLLGPSGCGKTTTLRMIAGLEHNDAGRITIADRVVSDASAGLFVAPERREIGMVFQSYAIWPHMTVAANVAYPLEVRRHPTAEVRERVAATLRLMQMEHLADRPATALSGGQQQRVAIARALMADPAMILADEPTGNLDSRSTAELLAIFQRLNDEGKTVVMVTHEPDVAEHCKRIVRMRDGKVFADETVTHPRRAEEEIKLMGAVA